ncbi:importin-11 isoform X1, partial [Tanacetum coccineum]
MALSVSDLPAMYTLLSNSLSRDESVRKPAESNRDHFENMPGFCSSPSVFSEIATVSNIRGSLLAVLWSEITEALWGGWWGGGLDGSGERKSNRRRTEGKGMEREEEEEKQYRVAGGRGGGGRGRMGYTRACGRMKAEYSEALVGSYVRRARRPQRRSAARVRAGFIRIGGGMVGGLDNMRRASRGGFGHFPPLIRFLPGRSWLEQAKRPCKKASLLCFCFLPHAEGYGRVRQRPTTRTDPFVLKHWLSLFCFTNFIAQCQSGSRLGEECKAALAGRGWGGRWGFGDKGGGGLGTGGGAGGGGGGGYWWRAEGGVGYCGDTSKASDLEEWHQNPELFHHEQDAVLWSEKPRPCAEALYIVLFHNHSQLLGPVVVSILQEAMNGCPPFVTDITLGLLLKDAAYDAVAYIYYELPNYLSFKDWFNNALSLELTNDHPNMRIIHRKVALILSQWVSE